MFKSAHNTTTGLAEVRASFEYCKADILVDIDQFSKRFITINR
jgi:hypothetical protein